MELKNTITEMKNTLEGINNRDRTGSELKDRMVEITITEQKKEWKEMRMVQETYGTIQWDGFWKGERKGLRKYLKR